MIWEETEEPWVYVARYSHRKYGFPRESPAAFQPPVAPALADTHFLCTDARASAPEIIYMTAEGLQHWQGTPLNPELVARFEIAHVLCLSLHSEHMRGHILIMDNSWMSSDALMAGAITARQVRIDMDQVYLLQRMQQVAAAEERVRLARNLHDGLLQSLTAAGLQLHAMQRLMEECSPAVRERLRGVQQLLASEQRDLRSFLYTAIEAGYGTSAGRAQLGGTLGRVGQ